MQIEHVYSETRRDERKFTSKNVCCILIFQKSIICKTKKKTQQPLFLFQIKQTTHKIARI